jgi:hypothetical protein
VPLAVIDRQYVDDRQKVEPLPAVVQSIDHTHEDAPDYVEGCERCHLERLWYAGGRVVEQPAPQSNLLPGVWSLVIGDMEERDQLGTMRYGTKLQPFNGRDALTDAYQEALDLAVYIRQALYERDGR